MRLLRDSRGAVTLVAALSLVVLLASTAFAVDLGSIYLARRQLQGAADDAALAAARQPADPWGAARRTIAASGLDAAIATLATGSYVADPGRASADRFTPDGTAGGARLTLTEQVPLYFGRVFTGRGSVQLTAGATAARIDYAAFSIGSRLAGISGGVPGALLSALAGTDLSLSAMDYDALARTDIDALAFASALRIRTGATAGTYGGTLAATATLPQAASAMADAIAGAGGNAAAVAALRGAALRLPATQFRASDLFDPGIFSALDHAAPGTHVTTDAYSLLRETLISAGGQRQVAVDLPSTAGLLAARLFLAVGERQAHSPWLAVARDGSVVVRTAQSRLFLDVALPGAATLGLVSLRLPLYVELAEAKAKLAAIGCAGGQRMATVSLSVSPSIGQAAVADIDTGGLANFSTPVAQGRATIAHALLADVTGQARIAFGGATWQTVAFSAADIAAGTSRTVTSNDAAQSIAGSLVRSLDLKLTALGGSIGLPGIAAPVGNALALAAPAVDGLLSQVLATLGIGLGQADVRVDGVRCGRPTLVA